MLWNSDVFNQFVQNWQTSLSDSSKALNYRIFKTKLEFEEYFNILSIGDAIRLCRFRTTNHYLPIETGEDFKSSSKYNTSSIFLNWCTDGDSLYICFIIIIIISFEFFFAGWKISGENYLDFLILIPVVASFLNFVFF